ncbi:ParB N-terminal domain-containing protein [Aureibacter tunicatorum]|uniref:ParB/Sulfiredoxin domain-containing protein n=1 Tax=Aureibacter tunicatorum TaxID=866807 RepID=A0AAE4BUP2_9BACT|nr:ParB N-terminal domain-containing protein [Aureibacter tunicatorum]MDR6241976.1 hypothetical protein [Aureibacter tunicatorum]BDD07529.1 hypothetical protein AUTU_50120 [Aureibacter tunicatorum]
MSKREFIRNAFSTEQDTVLSNVLIDPCLESYFPSLNECDLSVMTDSIRQFGIISPIILWKFENKNVLVDGFHRYRIAISMDAFLLRNNYKFIHFADFNQVKEWMISIHYPFRKLTTQQKCYYRGEMVLLTASNRNLSLSSAIELTSGKFSVSAHTIKNDYKYAVRVNQLKKKDNPLAKSILEGTSGILKRDLIKSFEWP